VEALRLPSSFTFTHHFLAVSGGTVQTQFNADDMHKLILIGKKLDQLSTQFEETRKSLLEKSDNTLARVQGMERNAVATMTRVGEICAEGFLVQVELLGILGGY
jgi:hypothetical protein